MKEENPSSVGETMEVGGYRGVSNHRGVGD